MHSLDILSLDNQLSEAVDAKRKTIGGQLFLSSPNDRHRPPNAIKQTLERKIRRTTSSQASVRVEMQKSSKKCVDER